MTEEQKAAAQQKRKDRYQKQKAAGTVPTYAGAQQGCPNPSCGFACSQPNYKRGMERHLQGTPACVEWVKEHGTTQVRNYLPKEEEDQTAGAGGQEAEP